MGKAFQLLAHYKFSLGRLQFQIYSRHQVLCCCNQTRTPPRGAQRHLLGARTEPASSKRLRADHLCYGPCGSGDSDTSGGFCTHTPASNCRLSRVFEASAEQRFLTQGTAKHVYRDGPVFREGCYTAETVLWTGLLEVGGNKPVSGMTLGGRNDAR